jgi:hypothetical protein
MNRLWLSCATLLIVGLMISLQTPASAVQKKPPPQSCGGLLLAPCPSGQLCQAPIGQCFVNPGTATCAVVPKQCFTINQPVCGCDGKTYRNNCLRLQAGVSLAKAGAC